MATTTQDVKGEFKCPHCDKTFETQRVLNGHISGHVKRGEVKANSGKSVAARRPEGQVECPHCHIAIRTMTGLAQHMKFAHPGLMSFQDWKKGQPEAAPTNGRSGKSFKCPYCPEKFRSKGGLSSHIRNAHPDKTQERNSNRSNFRHFCEVCQKGYTSNSAFYFHLNKSAEHKRNVAAAGGAPDLKKKPARRTYKIKTTEPEQLAVQPVHFCPNCGTDLQLLAVAIATANRMKS